MVKNQRTFWISFLGWALLVLLSACGQLESPNSDPNNQQNKYNVEIPPEIESNVCSPTYKGIDQDSDGLSDECEAKLGCDPFKSDTNGNGIGDKFDNPEGCGKVSLETCGNDCEAQKWNIFMDQNVQKGIQLGSAALTNNPGSEDILLEKQILVLGPLKSATGAVSSFANQTPSYLLAAVSSANPAIVEACDKPNSVFLMVRGQVNKNTSQIELCGILTSDQGAVTLEANAQVEKPELNNLNLQWKVGASFTSLFDMRRFSNLQSRVQTLSRLRIENRNQQTSQVDQKTYTIFNNLSLEMNSNYSVEFHEIYERYYGVQYSGGQTEKIQKSWKRTGSMAEQAHYSTGFKGMWVNCSSVLDLKCPLF